MWGDFRRKIIYERGHVCEICGLHFDYGHQLHVHHKCYYTDKKPWEYDGKDVMCLCVDCHIRLHAELTRKGEQIPVIDRGEGNELQWSAHMCRHCNGFGVLSEFPYILDGMCLYCLGSGEAGIHLLNNFDIQRLAKLVYHDWLTYHEDNEGFVDSLKFTCEKDVEDWLHKVH